ncbi:MAG: response regulator, partial [Verrucomicrobiaceae bacterium]
LGLATCYGIVKQSGGYITVESAAGKGATFRVYLPRVDESGEKAPARMTLGQLPGGNEIVLYVEDELTVRSLTAHVLRKLGYTVLEAGDAQQAKLVVEEHGGNSISMVFSDVVLPDACGRDLAAWMLTKNPAVRVLFTSGYVDEEILKQHGIDETSAFLQKPFTPADLACKVREVMESSGRLGEMANHPSSEDSIPVREASLPSAAN